jgi:hypothetical protein
MASFGERHPNLFLAATSVVGSRIGWISPAFTFTIAGQLFGAK